MTTITINGHAHSEAKAQLLEWTEDCTGTHLADGPYLVAKIAVDRVTPTLDPWEVTITTSVGVWKVIREALESAVDKAEEQFNQPAIDACEQSIADINYAIFKKEQS